MAEAEKTGERFEKISCFVIDANTARRWNAYMFHDTQTGLTWEKNSRFAMTWHDAMDFSSRLNAMKFGGFDDWRLPTIDEILSLADFDHYTPLSELGEPRLPCWSSSVYTGVDHSDMDRIQWGAWGIEFGPGYATVSCICYKNYVRCVRGSLKAR